jgi:hypothetical protein
VGTFTPARFAEYFRELAEIIERTGQAPDHDDWVRLYGRYHTTFHDHHSTHPGRDSDPEGVI